MIDPNKSLIIFSHHRSGSTWFQAGLSHFNTLELFNLGLTYELSEPREGFKHSIGEHYKLSYPRHRRHEAVLENELADRFKLYNDIESKHTPISVKIHTIDATDNVMNFLSTKDVNYVLIDRKDKISTFWSFIVSWSTLQFHSFTPTLQQIIITKETFDQVATMMLNFNDEVAKLKQRVPIKHIYYEDVLNFELSDWWVRPTNRIKIQGAANLTTILNKEELMGWIEEIDLFNRI